MARILTPEEAADFIRYFARRKQKRQEKEAKKAKRQKEEEYDKQMDALYEQQERQMEASKPETPSKAYDIPDWTD